MAQTIESVIQGGDEAFYRGPIAEEIIAFSNRHDGILSVEDFAANAPEWQDALVIEVGDAQVFAPPPPCQGIQINLALGLLQQDHADYDTRDVGAVHRMIEACKLAAASRSAYENEDRRTWDNLLSRENMARLRRQVSDRRAAPSHPGSFDDLGPVNGTGAASTLGALKENTTHLVAMDADGWLAACTQTIGGGPARGFGSGVVFGQSGILMNNFLHWFGSDLSDPNVVGPTKKVNCCMSPTQIWKNGQPFAAVGTPGSWGILQTTPQLIRLLLSRSHSVQSAIEAPRFRFDNRGSVQLETRFHPDVQAQLTALGHRLTCLGDWTPTVGGAHGVLKDPKTGSFQGGADPRRDGIALAW